MPETSRTPAVVPSDRSGDLAFLRGLAEADRDAAMTPGGAVFIGPRVDIEGLVVEGQGGFRLDVSQLSLVDPGKIVFLGANGSGKSTLLEAILGLITPTRGRVRVLGRDLLTADPADEIRQMIGAQIQGATWASSAKVAEILSIHRLAYGRSESYVLETLGIPELSRHTYRGLSTGQRRRVDLAVALAHEPRVIVLDEPVSGLDRRFEDGYRSVLERLAADGAMILVATHDERDLATAQRLIWLSRGRVIHDEAPAALVDRLIGQQVCTVEDADPQTAAQLAARFGSTAKVCRGEDGRLFLSGDDALREAFLATVSPLSSLAYAVRPARPSDLLRVLDSGAGSGSVS